MDENVIRTYRKDNPTVSVQGKIDMLNEMLHARLENELTGKFVSYTDEEKKELQRLYRWHFGKKEWKGFHFRGVSGVSGGAEGEREEGSLHGK